MCVPKSLEITQQYGWRHTTRDFFSFLTSNLLGTKVQLCAKFTHCRTAAFNAHFCKAAVASMLNFSRQRTLVLNNWFLVQVTLLLACVG